MSATPAVKRPSADGELIDAIKIGDLATVTRLVDADPKLTNSKRGTSNLSLLYFAAVNGHEQIVSYLLEKGAEVDAHTGVGSALHGAVAREHPDVVKILLKWKADPNLKDASGETPLHKTTRNHHAEVTQLLIQAGGDIAAVDDIGRTPLHRCKNAAVAKALVDAGANINAQDSYGYNALHWATTRREIVDAPTIEFLLEKGIDVSAKEKGGLTPQELAKRTGQQALIDILEKYAKEQGTPKTP